MYYICIYIYKYVLDVIPTRSTKQANDHMETWLLIDLPTKMHLRRRPLGTVHRQTC